MLFVVLYEIAKRSRPSHMTTSRTCHSSFLVDTPKPPAQFPTIKSDDYDYIDDDYCVSPSIYTIDPLIKCYHRHIREHIANMFIRYGHLCQLNPAQTTVNSVSLLVVEGKALVVAGRKLIFVLETLHEHLRHSTKVQQLQSPLVHLTMQLCDALTSFVHLLKQLSHDDGGTSSTRHFQRDAHTIMSVVKRIRQQCS